MAVGIGYDIHRFAPGRRLVLGGIDFPGEVGLEGHSDADVATHAIMDALLGAAALGDIGTHFPPSDDRYAGARSVDLLGYVVGLLRENAWRVGNVDVTVIAERPRIGPRAPEMRRSLGEAVGLDVGRISVKATTNERLGTIGRGEGIAAIAIAEIVRDEEPSRPSTPGVGESVRG